MSRSFMPCPSSKHCWRSSLPKVRPWKRRYANPAYWRPFPTSISPRTRSGFSASWSSWTSHFATRTGWKSIVPRSPIPKKCAASARKKAKSPSRAEVTRPATRLRKRARPKRRNVVGCQEALFTEVGYGLLAACQRTGARGIVHIGALSGIRCVDAWDVLQGTEIVACLVAVFALYARLFGFLVGLGVCFVGFLAAFLVGLVLGIKRLRGLGRDISLPRCAVLDDLGFQRRGLVGVMDVALGIRPFVEFGVRMGRDGQRAQKQKPSGVNPEGLAVESRQNQSPTLSRGSLSWAMPFWAMLLATLASFSTTALSPFAAAASAALSAFSAVVHRAFLALAALTSAWAVLSAAWASALMAGLAGVDSLVDCLAFISVQTDRQSRATEVRTSKALDIVLSPRVVWRSGVWLPTVCPSRLNADAKLAASHARVNRLTCDAS